MEEEHAGIYWHKEAEAEFYDLPEESQHRLADFMEGVRANLENAGGGNKENLAAIWDRDAGMVVSWDIQLKPQHRGGPQSDLPSLSTPLGCYYRIEVLKIWKLPR